MDKENFIAVLKRKRKLLTAAILLILGLNIAIYSHITSVKKAEQSRIALEKAEAKKKTADSLSVVQKKQEAERKVLLEKQAIEDAKEKRRTEWLESLAKYEIPPADSSGELFVDSITDTKSQRIMIECQIAPEDDVSSYIPVSKLKLNYYLFDEKRGTLSTKLQLKSLDCDTNEACECGYSAFNGPYKGSFTIGISSSEQFTPYPLRPYQISKNLERQISISIIPDSVELELTEFRFLGKEGNIIRVLANYSPNCFICFDYDLKQKHSKIQFIYTTINRAPWLGIDGYACFSSDGRANVIAASTNGSEYIFAYRNGKWKEYWDYCEG